MTTKFLILPGVPRNLLLDGMADSIVCRSCLCFIVQSLIIIVIIFLVHTMVKINFSFSFKPCAKTLCPPYLLRDIGKSMPLFFFWELFFVFALKVFCALHLEY